MRQIITPISGGSHTGKTTLLHALELEFPDAYFAPEPASLVMNEQQRLAEETGADPALPWTDNHRFSGLVVREALHQELIVPPAAGLVIKDRSLVDALAYSRADNFPDLAARAERLIARFARYACVFFCEPIDGYHMTHERRETLPTALRLHAYLRRAYPDCNVPLISLPSVPVPKRVAIVREHIDSLVSAQRLPQSDT